MVVSKTEPRISSYLNFTQIEIIVLTSKNVIFNGSLFANSENSIGLVASKWVKEWSWILIQSLGWPCTQNKTNFNCNFTDYLKKRDFFVHDFKHRQIIYRWKAFFITSMNLSVPQNKAPFGLDLLAKFFIFSQKYMSTIRAFSSGTEDTIWQGGSDKPFGTQKQEWKWPEGGRVKMGSDNFLSRCHHRQRWGPPFRAPLRLSEQRVSLSTHRWRLITLGQKRDEERDSKWGREKEEEREHSGERGRDKGRDDGERLPFAGAEQRKKESERGRRWEYWRGKVAEATWEAPIWGFHLFFLTLVR